MEKPRRKKNIHVSSILDFCKTSTVVPDGKILVKLTGIKWRWMYKRYKMMVEGGPEEADKKPC